MAELKQRAVDQIVREVWDSLYFLGPAGTLEDGGPLVTGWVRIQDERKNYLVILECTENLLRCTTGVVFSREPSKVTWHLMQVTLAEIVNMIGGNLKAILGVRNKLSLPQTVEETGEKPILEKGKLLLDLPMDYRNGHITVRVLETTGAPAPQDEESAGFN